MLSFQKMPWLLRWLRNSSIKLVLLLSSPACPPRCSPASFRSIPAMNSTNDPWTQVSVQKQSSKKLYGQYVRGVGAVYNCIYIPYVFKHISKNKSHCLFSVYLHGSSNLACWDLATLCHHSYCFGHFFASESELLFLARTNRFKSWKPPGGLVFPTNNRGNSGRKKI